jgi:hypothetical protein
LAVRLELNETKICKFTEVPMNLAHVTVDEASSLANPAWLVLCNRPKQFKIPWARHLMQLVRVMKGTLEVRLWFVARIKCTERFLDTLGVAPFKTDV